MAEQKKVKKKYTYREIIGADHMTSIAIGKLSDLYIPDMGEMNKLIPLLLERKRVMEAFEICRKKIITAIDESEPAPKDDDDSDEAEKKRISRRRELNKKTIELIDQECTFEVASVTIKPKAMQRALEKESDKKPKEIKNICTECGALVSVIDADRNVLKVGDFALLSDFLKIKKGSE